MARIDWDDVEDVELPDEETEPLQDGNAPGHLVSYVQDDLDD